MDKKKSHNMTPKLFVLSPDMHTNQLVARSQRLSRACDFCKKRKTKCEGGNPCYNCKKAGMECIYRQIASGDTTVESLFGDKGSSSSRNRRKQNNILAVKYKKGSPSINPKNAITTSINKIINTDSDNSPNVYDTKIESQNQPIESSRSSTSFNDNVGLRTPSDIYKDISEAIFSSNNLDKILRTPSFEKERFINMISSHISNGVFNINSVLNSYIPSRIRIQLPPKDIATKLVMKTWDCVCILFRFYHRPTIMNILESFYETENNPNNTYSNEQLKVRPLIYSVLAVGALFCKQDVNEKDVSTRTFYDDEGQKFFQEAKKLLNLLDVKDLYSIQALFMMTMFLQCTADIKTCYSYVGISMRSLVKEGYHRKSSLSGENAIKDESKKRLFWSIFKVDLYLNSIMGIPFELSEKDVDQEFPLDLDDECITENGILPSNIQLGISSAGANNEHTKLVLIMSHISKKMRELNRHRYDLSFVEQEVRKLETSLNDWYVKLPIILKPETPVTVVDKKTERSFIAKKLLYLDYLLAKLSLYKPFAHYIIMPPTQFPFMSFHFSTAKKCFEIAYEIIVLSKNMLTENLLSGSYWFSMHTIFYSVSCLEFYSYQFHRGLIQENILSFDFEETSRLGMMILLKLKEGSKASEKTFNVLKALFGDLNRRTSDASIQILQSVKAAHASNNMKAPLIVSHPVNVPYDRHGYLKTPALPNYQNIAIYHNHNQQGGPASHQRPHLGASQSSFSSYESSIGMNQAINYNNRTHEPSPVPMASVPPPSHEPITVSRNGSQEDFAMLHSYPQNIEPEEYFNKFLDDFKDDSVGPNIDIRSLLSSPQHR
ncbi:hypothetical protein RNJ44_01045 [Nakaseomyces bracarensis]|uniref:Zn(2)-C6 fungal-type domain-containing protein n=1 Tax=Nakaseomyces bracarensis TaxID=273131 RepID=A0ABR4NQR9_9SACH